MSATTGATPFSLYARSIQAVEQCCPETISIDLTEDEFNRLWENTPAHEQQEMLTLCQIVRSRGCLSENPWEHRESD